MCKHLSILILIFSTSLFASNSLFFFESQVVAGYSDILKKEIYYSISQEDTMQKPSLGFDLLRKFSKESGDVATLGLQARLAYDKRKKYNIEPQLYNAYIKAKLNFTDLWIGHNRIAFGLSSYFDSHGLLLPLLSMLGFSYDRDWGAGIYKTSKNGDFGLSFTTASGMPLVFKKNYAVSSRYSFGILEQENFSVGLSAMLGNTLDTMGYEIMSDNPQKTLLAAVDFSYLFDNFEFRFDSAFGKKNDISIYGVLLRIGMNLLEENRLKIEIQPVRINGNKNFELFSNVSFIITSSLSFRLMHDYNYLNNGNMVILQLYYYIRAL